MNASEKLHFRDRLRDARASTLEDAEDFVSIVQVLEDLGKRWRHLHSKKKQGTGFGDYHDELKELIKEYKYEDLSSGGLAYNSDFDRLFKKVNNGRNEAVHQGVFARHLADSALELALIIEDALAMELNLISDFMVRGVVVAETWQPLSFIRMTMLKTSFSYLPFYDNGWKLVSDLNLASYLGVASSNTARKKLLVQTLQDSLGNGLKAENAVTLPLKTTIHDGLMNSQGRPILIVEEGHLIGIVTPFDLL